MHLLHIVMSKQGWYQVGSNADRLGLLDLLIAHAVKLRVGLLVLPAGFLAANNQEDVHALIRKVEESAIRAQIAVIGGVDLVLVDRNLDNEVRAGQLPSFGFAVGHLVPAGCFSWRQVSTNNVNAEFVADADIPGNQRVVTVDGFRIAVLICGEIFNRRARERIIDLRPNLVVDLGHSGMGCGLIPAMMRIANDSQCAVAHAQHLATERGRHIHFVTSEGERDSIAATQNGLLRSSNLWAGWALRELQATGA